MRKIDQLSDPLRLNLKEVAMPMIGAGLGGGDWNVIEAIIESELKTVKPYVYALER